MKTLVLASNNRKKIAELETFLASASSKEISVRSLGEIGWTQEIEENGSSFEENSLIKARVPASRGYIGIADDSGLAVDCLGGAPGIYSARYSGEGTDAANRKKLLRELDGVPAEKRTARFVCAASAVFPECSGIVVPEAWRIPAELAEKLGVAPERAMTVRGECEGVILTEERGEGGFGYDSLFFYPPFGGTFAEIEQEKKNLVSHRGRAMREFMARLTALLNEER
ncbi:MAG: non-canonical purine NTP pyrophosphatase [Clostridia bacterium]|nr:non-canonical purine NTP pyrophosphatase [Clostridia bacterium]